MVERTLEERIRQRMGDSKVLLLFGARQVGKTTLLQQMYQNRSDVLWLNGDYAPLLLPAGNLVPSPY